MEQVIEDTGIDLAYSAQEIMKLADICSMGIGMRIDGYELLQRLMNGLIVRLGPGRGVVLTGDAGKIDTIKNSGNAIAVGIAFSRKE